MVILIIRQAMLYLDHKGGMSIIITKTSTGTWYQINDTTFVFEGVSEPPIRIAWIQQGYDLIPYGNIMKGDNYGPDK